MAKPARWAAALAIAVFVAGAGVLALTARNDGRSYAVQGSLSLDPGAPLAEQFRRALKAAGPDVEAAERAVVGSDCSGGYPTTGYADIRTGAAVTVSDEAGTTVATTTLGPGKVSELPLRCVFTFTVEVPETTFYRFEVSHRGQIQKSFEEMKADGWKVSLTLG